MKRYLPFGLAAILTVGIAASAWSQAGQSGGAGTAGTAGTAGAAGTARAAGAVNTPGAAGTAGVGAPSVPPNVNIGANPQSQGVGANPQSRGAGANPQSRGAGANPATRAPGFGQSIPQTPFFTDPGVRQQLNLNDNQFNTLNRAYRNAFGRFNRSVGGLSNNLTLQQRQAQFDAFTNQFNTEFNQSLDTTFTDPQVRARFDQLNRQYMGFSAFNNPALQRQLNLTPQQMVQIRQLASVWRQRLMDMRRQGGNASINNIDAQQWATLYNQYWDQVTAVLTPDQQQMWMQLAGQRFNFSPNVFISGDESANVQGQVSDGTTPVNPSGQIYGGNVQLKGGTPAQGGQNPPASNQQAPQGGTANSGTQGGTVR